ncbi:MAG: DUF4158 domain-containing protein, partial [Thermomicrobiales bacterium]
MPRRRMLSAAERVFLVAIPTTDDELIRHYTLCESDVTVIQQHRGRHNRLGFVVQPLGRLPNGTKSYAKAATPKQRDGQSTANLSTGRVPRAPTPARIGQPAGHRR